MRKRDGFRTGTWQDYQMCLDATKEAYRIRGYEWNKDEEKKARHDIMQFNKFQCMNYLRKVNKFIKDNGGNIIQRK